MFGVTSSKKDRMSAPRYHLLSTSDSSPERELELQNHHDITRRRSCLWSWAAQTLALAIGVALGFSIGRLHGLKENSTPSEKYWMDDWQTYPKSRPLFFNSSITPNTKFTGRGPLVDAEWDRFTQNNTKGVIDGTAVVLAVSEADIARSGKATDDYLFDTTVVVDLEDGQGYMATIEVFHQLHCLNILRMFVHREYYQTREEYFQPTPNPHHSNHCVEILRQVIMCNSDPQLITFHWVDGWQGPVPDFNTQHQCRDPEEVLEWALERSARLRNTTVYKPAGVKALSERP